MTICGKFQVFPKQNVEKEATRRISVPPSATLGYATARKERNGVITSKATFYDLVISETSVTNFLDDKRSFFFF